MDKPKKNPKNKPKTAMVMLEPTALNMGVRLSGKVGQLTQLGDGFIQLGLTHPVEEVGEQIAQFGDLFKAPPYGKSITAAHTLRVSWPRLVYILTVLEKLTAPLGEESLEKLAVASMSTRAGQELRKRQKKCSMPIAHFIGTSLPFYEGEFVEGLLLMAELGFARHLPIADRINYLTTTMDILSPGAWLHYDILAFVKSIAHDIRSMDILRFDLDYDFSRKRW